MMGRKKLKEKVAGKIAKVATYYVKNTVGKSFPIWQHEIEVPKEVRDILKEEC